MIEVVKMQKNVLGNSNNDKGRKLAHWEARRTRIRF